MATDTMELSTKRMWRRATTVKDKQFHNSSSVVIVIIVTSTICSFSSSSGCGSLCISVSIRDETPTLRTCEQIASASFSQLRPGSNTRALESTTNGL